MTLQQTHLHQDGGLIPINVLRSDEAILKSDDGDMRHSEPLTGRLNARSKSIHADGMGKPENELIDDAALTNAARQ